VALKPLSATDHDERPDAPLRQASDRVHQALYRGLGRSDGVAAGAREECQSFETTAHVFLESDQERQR
jgi:hypothetical protein